MIMKSYSPLRYPGGKTQLYLFISALIKNNFSYSPIYVEPFCGGGGLALKLLIQQQVKQIYLNDADVNIYAFWITLTKYNDDFIKFIHNVPITIAEWKKQKAIYESKNVNIDLFQKGCATFFLNRTNYSGILSAGPIGGFQQKSNYKIDCRFNKKKLINMVQQISCYQDKIKIFNLDAKDFLLKVKLPLANSFFYFDPPYVKKGPELYQNAFQAKDHQLLADIIKKIKYKWLLTYDDHVLIRKLYKGYFQQLFDIRYSLKKKNLAQEIFILSHNMDK